MVLSYDDLLSTYNKLYADKINVTVPKEEESKTYTIKLPDGKVETINGKDLYKARFRYVTTKNGDITIEITENGKTPEKITYDKVTNIDKDGCIHEEGDYTYTYNCLHFLDDGMLFPIQYFGTVFGADSEITEEEAIDKVQQHILNYRFNLGGWNASSFSINSMFMGSKEDETLTAPCKETVNGEPVTSMVGTYYYTTLQFEGTIIKVPDTVKYMFDTFRGAEFPENVTEIILPSVEYGAYIKNGSSGLDKNITWRINEKVKCFGKYGISMVGHGHTIEDLFNEPNVEKYTK